MGALPFPVWRQWWDASVDPTFATHSVVASILLSSHRDTAILDIPVTEPLRKQTIYIHGRHKTVTENNTLYFGFQLSKQSVLMGKEFIPSTIVTYWKAKVWTYKERASKGKKKKLGYTIHKLYNSKRHTFFGVFVLYLVRLTSFQSCNTLLFDPVHSFCSLPTFQEALSVLVKISFKITQPHAKDAEDRRHVPPCLTQSRVSFSKKWRK